MAALDGALRLAIHLPTREAGRFHFGGVLVMGRRRIVITPELLATLLPELAPYVGLHGADHCGTPPRVEMQAWYHAAGVVARDQPDADSAPAEVCTRRFAALMRIDPDHARYHLDRLARMGQEFDDVGILRHEVALLVADARPRWQREAATATAFLPALLETLA